MKHMMIFPSRPCCSGTLKHQHVSWLLPTECTAHKVLLELFLKEIEQEGPKKNPCWQVTCTFARRYCVEQRIARCLINRQHTVHQAHMAASCQKQDTAQQSMSLMGNDQQSKNQLALWGALAQHNSARPHQEGGIRVLESMEPTRQQVNIASWELACVSWVSCHHISSAKGMLRRTEGLEGIMRQTWRATCTGWTPS